MPSKPRYAQAPSLFARWAAALEASSTRAFWASYAVLFALMFAAFAGGFLIQGKSFIWTDDGLTQQYTVFVELGAWLRELLGNLLIDHVLEVPMWSPEVGYGIDRYLWVCAALGNPINWIAAFGTAETAEALLCLTVPITLFLAGAAFAKLALYHRLDRLGVLLGAVIYAFSGTSIIAFVQIFLIYPLLLAPLVVLGVDKVFAKESPVLFVAAMALAALYSVYNTWMVCLLLLAYCLVRYAFLPERKGVRHFAGWFARIAGLLVLGIAIGAVVFLPNALALLSMGRVGLERSWDLLYPLDYYLQLIPETFALGYVGSECFIGFCSLAIIVVVAFLASPKDRTGKMLLVLFACLTAILLLPFLGKVLNGFAYPTNRWDWAYTLLVSYLVAYELPRLLKGPSAATRRLAVTLAFVLAGCLVLALVAGKSYLLALAAFVLTALGVLATRGNGPRIVAVASTVLCTALVFGLWGRATGGRNVDIGSAWEMATAGANAAAAELEEGAWRFDALGAAMPWRNTSSLVDRNGTSFYSSVYNGAIDDYHTALGLTTSPLNFSVTSLDGRTIVEQFAGVEYVMVAAGQEGIAPALYDLQVPLASAAEGGVRVLEAQESLPLAVLYDRTLTNEELAALPPVELQEALLQAVALDDPVDPMGASSLQSYSSLLPCSYEVQATDASKAVEPLEGDAEATLPLVPVANGTTAQDSAIDGLSFATDGPATLSLDAAIPAGTEAYLVLEGVDFSPSQVAPAGASTLERLQYALSGLFPMPDNGCNISVTAPGCATGVWQTGKDAHLYSGKSTWAFCLGSSDVERQGVQASFDGAGSYRIARAYLCAESTEAVIGQLREAASHGASDVALEGNVLRCAVAPEDGYDTLLVRLPFSTGWSATVDGAPLAIQRADLGFIGLELDQAARGEALDVALTYETPGLRAGALVSVIALAASAGLWGARRRWALSHGPRSSRDPKGVHDDSRDDESQR